MATTSNLGLTIYDTASGSATTFLTFRLALAGNSSNMSILDAWVGDTNASIIAIENNLLVTVDASLISTNYYEATVAAITSYVTDSMISLKLNVANTGAVTLNINSLGVKTLKKVGYDGELTDIESGDIKENRRTLFFYDGTYYVLMGATTADQVAIYGNEDNVLSISASGIMQDSGISSSSILLEISGSGIMSDTSGSVVKHNGAGITSGSYNRVTVSTLGHVISGSQVNYQTVSSIAGSAIMTNTTGSVVKHNTSGITSGSYTRVQVDAYGHVTAGSQIAYQTVSDISGSAIMSDTSGSVVKHNTSGITAGSYTKIIVDSYGHILSGSGYDGEASFKVVSKQEDYELLLTDYVCLASGSIILTLPDASGNLGKSYIVKNTGSSGSDVALIAASGSIENASQLTLNDLDSTRLISDNSSWWTI